MVVLETGSQIVWHLRLRRLLRMQQRWLLHLNSGPDSQEGRGVCPNALSWTDTRPHRAQGGKMTRIIQPSWGVWWWGFLTLQVTPALPAAKTARVKTSAMLSLLPAPFYCPGQGPRNWVGAVSLLAVWSSPGCSPRKARSAISAQGFRTQRPLFSPLPLPPQSYQRGGPSFRPCVLWHPPKLMGLFTSLCRSLWDLPSRAMCKEQILSKHLLNVT